MKNINEFNEQTQLIIKQFIEDLFTVLPSLHNSTSKEKIEEKILKNLEHNIEFNAELKHGISGQYSYKDKKISISNSISNNVQQIKLVLFHELIHAVTADMYTDELIKKNPYIGEVLTTLLEERYNQMIVKKTTHNDRVNGYIPDFGRQLHIVYGDKLLEQFIVDPLNIHLIFNGFSENIKRYLYKKTVKDLNALDYLIKNMDDDSKVKFMTKEIEKTIVDQLFYKVSINNISEYFGMIEKLFSSQYYPDASTYFGMLFKISDPNQLEGYPLLQCLKNIDQTGDREKLIKHLPKRSIKDFPVKQVRSIIMQKLFGYICDNVEELEPNIFDFLENEDVYSIVFDLITDGDVSIDEIDKLKFKRCSNPISKFSTKLTFDVVPEILGNSFLPTFALFDSNDSMISVFNEYELHYKKYQIEDIEKIITVPEISSKIISYLNCLSEKTSIYDFYLDPLIMDFDDEWEDFDFEIYYRNSEFELTQVRICFDENKELKFKTMTISMNESKSLVVQSNNVNLGTNSI